MTREADCRRCIWFVPLSRMDDELKRRALEWCAMYRPNQSLKGWCRAWRRPVTYYYGTCPKFRTREETLLRWLKR